jgi:hypothetical protein
MGNFGALTDHFGVAALSEHLELISSSKTPVAKSRTDAQDENGDIAAATWFGSETQDECETVVLLKSGTLNLNTLYLGEVDPGVVVTGITVETSNGAFPRITVTGKTGCENIEAPATKANTYRLPSLTIAGKKQAQLMGFTVGQGKLTGTSFAFSCNLMEETGGLGVPVAHGVDGAVGTLTANFVAHTDNVPAWTLTLSGLTETAHPSTDEPQAGYHTSTATAEMTLARDAAP